MGSLFKQQYTRNGVTKTLSKWYGEFIDKDGKTRRVPLSTDKQAAKAMLAEVERRVEREKAGLVDEFAETRQAPIQGLVDSYFKHMRLKGDGERHISDTRRLLAKVLEECGFDTLGKLKASVLDSYLADLSRPDGHPASARTKNTYRQAVMGFANWCVAKGKVEYNPLSTWTRFAYNSV